MQCQLGPVVEAVVDGLPNGAAGHAGAFELQPRAKLVPQRLAQPLSPVLAVLGCHAGELSLHVVDPRPALQRLDRHGAGPGVARGQLFEAAPRMRSAARRLAAGHCAQHRVVARELVAHQRAAPGRLGVRGRLPAQEGQRELGPAAGAELVDDPRRAVEHAARIGLILSSR